MDILRRIGKRLYELRGYAATGALTVTGILVAKMLADLPRGIEKFRLEGWGANFTETTEIILIFACIIGSGAIIGLVIGLLVQREDRPARDPLRTKWKRLE